MAFESSNAKNVDICPYCKEIITKGAIRCRHCSADIKVPPKTQNDSSFLTGIMVGIFVCAAAFFIYSWLTQ